MLSTSEGAMGNTSSKGRRRLSGIEKAFKAWVRSAAHLAEVEQELDSMIAVPIELRAQGRGLDVMAVVNERLAINRRLDAVISELGSLVRIKKPSLMQIDEIKNKKNTRTELFALLNDLPELGATHQEWGDVADEFKQKAIGRPRVSVELRYVRAQKAYEHAEIHVRKEELSAGFAPLTLDQVKEKFGYAKEKAGRPGMTDLDRLDVEVKRISLLLKVAKEELEDIPHCTSLDKNIASGRPSISVQEKIENYQGRLSKLAAEIDEAESKLGNVGMIDRDLKSKRQQLKRLSKGKAPLDEVNILKSEIAEITKYREFVKKVESGKNARKPYSLEYERMVEFNKRYIVNNHNKLYIME